MWPDHGNEGNEGYEITILEENQTGRRLQSINQSVETGEEGAERRGEKRERERREKHDVSGWERLTLSWHVRRHLLSPLGDLLQFR